MELSETDQDPLLKVDKVAKTITHSFHCLDRIVNPFNDARGHPMNEVVQDIFFPIIEHIQKVIQMLVINFPSRFHPSF